MTISQIGPLNVEVFVPLSPPSGCRQEPGGRRYEVPLPVLRSGQQWFGRTLIASWRANMDTVIQIHDVAVVHADAARGHQPPIEPGLGMSAEVRPSQPVGTVHIATVSVIDKVLDAASDTFGVRLMVPNPKHEMPAGVNCTTTFPFLGK